MQGCVGPQPFCIVECLHTPFKRSVPGDQEITQYQQDLLIAPWRVSIRRWRARLPQQYKGSSPAKSRNLLMAMSETAKYSRSPPAPTCSPRSICPVTTSLDSNLIAGSMRAESVYVVELDMRYLDHEDTHVPQQNTISTVLITRIDSISPLACSR
jgi:hypothetical protein